MKAKYIKRISGKERKFLKKIYRKCQGKISYRALIILLATEICETHPVERIARICQCSIKTVYNTFERFNKEGIPGLFDKERSGRPCLINKEVSKEILPVFLSKSPREVGKYIHSKWTLKVAKDYLQKKYSVETSQRTVGRWFYSNGWSYHRSKRELQAPQGISTEKRETVINLLTQIDHNREVIVFLDQSAFYLAGIPSGTWMPRGVQKKVTVSGCKSKFWVFGVFNPHTSRVYYRICEACNSHEMILFLYQIRQQFAGKVIHIVLDNAKFHTSEETSAFFTRHPDIIPHFLPTRASRLNPIERFWLFAKQITVASAVFQSMDHLYQTLRQFFWQYQQRIISYNFDLSRLVSIWRSWPSL